MGTILTGIGVLIGLVTLILSRKKEKPELTIEFKRNGGMSSNIGRSNKSKPNEEGVYEMQDAILIIELKYNFEIIIRNNSEITAYYPQIYFNKNRPVSFQIDKLNELEPIPSKESKTLNAVFVEVEEVKGQERTDIRKFPEKLERFEILLEYKNHKKTTFYTIFKNTDKSNIFVKKKPKDF